MADTKISALTDGSPLQATDNLVVARAGADYKIPASALQEFLASDKKVRTSGDVSFTSTTFAVIDTGLNITLTTGARRCLVAWTLVAKNGAVAPAAQQQVDVELDGTRVGQAFGLVFQGGGASNENSNLAGSFVTDVLSAGSHTFKLMFRVDGNTSTIYASTTRSPIVFSVVELAA